MHRSIADRLRDRMFVERVDTYDDLAARLGVSQPTVSRWLGGDVPGDDKVVVLARFLDEAEGDVLRWLHDERQEQRRAKAQQSVSPRAAAIEERQRLYDSVVQLLNRHGFTVQEHVRDVGVDLVARRENEVIGVAVKRLGGLKNRHNRLHEAIADVALFNSWANARMLESARAVVVVDEQPPEGALTVALRGLGAQVVFDDFDAVLGVGGVGSNVLDLTGRVGAAMLADAAHDGDIADDEREVTTRPRPEPEPDQT